MKDIELKDKDIKELNEMSKEIRDFLIKNISKSGGHLASNLGVVEITLAIHKVFDLKHDSLIFDVGHQSYIHKYLTGRKDRFGSLRKLGGLSGFPKVEEDIRDTFNSGHASNSISIGMGISEAKLKNKDKSKTIVLIGDGALSGGLSYEGLNNVGIRKTPLIIILNDNQHSISKNSGYITKHLRNLRVSYSYTTIKNFVKKASVKVPFLGKVIYVMLLKIKNFFKHGILNNSIFELLGIKYLGPYDAHNLEELLKIFKSVKKENEPVLVHLISKKGKGYKIAEKDPEQFHGVKDFDIETGINNSPSIMTMSKVAGDEIINLAKKDRRVVAITAAMSEGTGLSEFKKKYEKRFYDVGIAESHAVSFANGLSLKGLKPFVFIYSSFLERAYDNILTETCLMKLNVTFVLDRSGLVGEDGETHNGLFDISYLRSMPNIIIFSPSNEHELRKAFNDSLSINGPVAIRIYKGKIRDDVDIKDMEGKDYTIFSFGYFLNTAKKVALKLREKNKNIKVVNLTKIKPLKEEQILGHIRNTKNVITIEDNVLSGGFSESINSLIKKHNVNVRVMNFTFPDKFIEHGSVESLIKKYSLDEESITNKILNVNKEGSN